MPPSRASEKVGSGALLPPPEPPLEELTPTVPSPRTAPSQHATVEPFLAVVLELRPDRIAALLLETAPAATARPGAVDATPAGIAVSDASPALIDAIGRLLALLDAPEDAAALAAGVEREVLWRLLTAPQGTTVRQIGLADSRLAHLARRSAGSAATTTRRCESRSSRDAERLLVPPPLPRGHLDDADPVPEADPPSAVCNRCRRCPHRTGSPLGGRVWPRGRLDRRQYGGLA